MHCPILKRSHGVAAVALLLAAISADGARAEFQTGDDLLEFCRDISDAGYGRCIGYLEGTADSMEAARAARHLPRCVPEGTDMSKLYSVVMQYLLAHPDERRQSASLLVATSLANAWGCGKPAN